MASAVEIIRSQSEIKNQRECLKIMTTHKLLLITGAAVLALAATPSARADLVTINFSDLPLGITFPYYPAYYDGLYWATEYGDSETTATGLELDSPEILAFGTSFAFGIPGNGPASFTLDSITVTSSDVFGIIDVDPNGYFLSGEPLIGGTYTDPFSGAALGGVEIGTLYPDSWLTINSITLDITPAPEPSQMISGLALTGLGGLSLWVRRIRHRS